MVPNLSNYPKGVVRAIEQRTIAILLQLHKNTGKSLKECGLYQMTNRGENLIIDQFPTINSSRLILEAYRIAAKELTKE